MQNPAGLPYDNLTTHDVRARLESGPPMRLIDVREPHEHAVAQIAGAELLPLSQAHAWISALPRDAPIVFFCHHGYRSQQIAAYLAVHHGYTNLANMLGGIDEWSRLIDPAVPRY